MLLVDPHKLSKKKEREKKSKGEYRSFSTKRPTIGYRQHDDELRLGRRSFALEEREDAVLCKCGLLVAATLIKSKF